MIMITVKHDPETSRAEIHRTHRMKPIKSISFMVRFVSTKMRAALRRRCYTVTDTEELEVLVPIPSAEYDLLYA